MHSKVREWVNLYEEQILQRRLLPDEYLFPAFSSNGLVNSQKPMDHGVFNTYLNELTSDAGIEKTFSSHCFRRGGAQYRFAHCPIGERWSLSMIRWWGGWTDGEQVRPFGLLRSLALD